MASSSTQQIPGTPRVISPSPDTFETAASSGKDGYFPPVTRSSTRKSVGIPPAPSIRGDAVHDESSSDSESRARSRSRSRDATLRRRRMSGLPAADGQAGDPSIKMTSVSTKLARPKAKQTPQPNGTVNGHLSPASAAKYYWRELSRSPSPLGLIPIHREWRSFVHRHEIPRKALHVSIGFLTLGLYAAGYQTSDIPPFLMALLVPIALVDILRHNWPPFNRFYIRCLGAFMRETEAHEKYNGVIWYLVGAWMVLRFCPKDVGVMSVLLLSWCDTAASTFGRMWGRYTPRIRRGKSLAGSLAACAMGFCTAVLFWGVVGPRYAALGVADNTGVNAFAFQGQLALPSRLWEGATVTGGIALGLMGLCAGVIASVSEAIDVFGWDDNVTIPIFCGAGLWGFLKIFGAS